MRFYLYIYKQIETYSVNEKVNLFSDLKNLILINIFLVLLISDRLIFFK